MYEQLPKFVRDPQPDIYISSSNFLVLDFECTNREHGSALDGANCLLLACWRVGQAHVLHDSRNVGVCWGDEFGQHELLAAVSTADFIIAHNAKFEMQWLRRCGIDLRRVLPFDTMIAEKIIHGNVKVPLSLDATAARRGLGNKGSTVSALIKAGACPSTVPKALLEAYCHQDVALTEAVFLEQRQELQRLRLLPVMYSRCLVTPVLADIEFNGMVLDPKRVEKTHGIYTEKYASLAKKLEQATGGINPKSGKQMREHIYGALGFAELTDQRGNAIKTGAGQAKTDKHTLAALVAVTPEQKLFKELAVELVKLKVPVQNLEKMQKICEASPDDPRIFASFNQTVTQTDRLSSTARNGGFNFQNLDREFRKLFRAGAGGRVLCDADAPQLEFRVAAYLGNDTQAKADILGGVDVHAATAKFVGVSRQEAKSRTFRPLYGGRSGTPRERRYIAYFTERYSGIYRTQTEWTHRVARDKYLITATGLRFYWPDTTIKEGGYVTNTTQIFNYAIQSLATADIMPLVLVCIWHRISDLGDAAVLTNTVHDSILGDVADAAVDEYKKIVIQAFTADIYPLLKKLYGIDFDVPLGVGIKTAVNWTDTKIEEKHEPSK